MEVFLFRTPPLRVSAFALCKIEWGNIINYCIPLSAPCLHGNLTPIKSAVLLYPPCENECFRPIACPRFLPPPFILFPLVTVYFLSFIFFPSPRRCFYESIQVVLFASSYIFLRNALPASQVASLRHTHTQYTLILTFTS